MIKIRGNVFETNSSSMHSIALLNKDCGKITSLDEAMTEDNNMLVSYNGELVIRNEDELEFGWGFEILDTFYGRLRYAIASLVGDTHIENLQMIEDEVRKIIPEITSIKLPLGEEDKLCAGYVDHESMGTLHSYLTQTGKSLSDYLADKSVIVVIDNDNDCHFSEIVSSGIYNEKSFKEGFVPAGAYADEY